MTNKLKEVLLISSSTCILVLLYHFLAFSSLNKTQIADTLFLAALFFLILGLILFVLSSGFFDFFHYSSLYLAALLRKKEPKTKAFNPNKGLSSGFGKRYQIFLFTSLILAGISIALSFL